MPDPGPNQCSSYFDPNPWVVQKNCLLKEITKIWIYSTKTCFGFKNCVYCLLEFFKVFNIPVFVFLSFSTSYSFCCCGLVFVIANSLIHFFLIHFLLTPK